MNAQEIHVQLSETRQHLRSEVDSLRSQRDTTTRRRAPGPGSLIGSSAPGRRSSPLSSSCSEDGEDETGAAQRPGTGKQLRRVRASGRMQPARSRVTRGTPVATGVQRRGGGVEGRTASARLQLAANNLRGNDRGNDRARSWLAQQGTGDISRTLRTGGGQSVRVAAGRSVGQCVLQPRASSGVGGIVSGVLPVNGGSELPSGRFLGGSWRFGCLTNE